MRLEKIKTRAMSSVFCFLIASLVFSSDVENYPEALRVSGLVGKKFCMNGVYYRGDGLKFGHPLYQKKETEDQIPWTIRWNDETENARWLLMYNPQKRDSVIAYLESDYLLHSKAWLVKGEKRWEENPDMKLSEWDGKHEFVKMVQKIEAQSQHVCPKALKLSGNIGSMGGVYHLGDSLHCDRIFYQKKKTDTNHWTISWYPEDSKWILNKDGLKADGFANAILKDNVLLPLLSAKKWKYNYNGENWNTNLPAQIREWKGTSREVLAKMQAITPYFLWTIIYGFFALPVLSYLASSFRLLWAGEFKQSVVSFLAICIQMFYRKLYQYFFGEKLQQKFGQKISNVIGEVSFYIVYFLLEAVVMGNLYLAFLSIVAIMVAKFTSSILSKLLKSTTRLSDEQISWVRFIAFMLVWYSVSRDNLDFLLFRGTNRYSAQFPDIDAFKKCTEAKKGWPSFSKETNPLIESYCNEFHPCNTKVFLERVLNFPLNSNISAYSTLPEEICSMSMVDFHANAKGGIYSQDDCTRSYKKCARNNHPDKGGTREKFDKGCTTVQEQCNLLAQRQNSYIFKIHDIFARVWAHLFSSQQQVQILLLEN